MGLEAVLVIPETPVRTDQARAALPAQVPMADAVFNVACAATLTLGLATGDWDLIAAGLRDRLHQPYRAHLYPRSAELLERAPALGRPGGDDLRRRPDGARVVPLRADGGGRQAPAGRGRRAGRRCCGRRLRPRAPTSASSNRRRRVAVRLPGTRHRHRSRRPRQCGSARRPWRPDRRCERRSRGTARPARRPRAAARSRRPSDRAPPAGPRRSNRTPVTRGPGVRKTATATSSRAVKRTSAIRSVSAAWAWRAISPGPCRCRSSRSCSPAPIVRLVEPSARTATRPTQKPWRANRAGRTASTRAARAAIGIRITGTWRNSGWAGRPL